MKQQMTLRSLLVITSILLGFSLHAQVVTIHVETPGTLSSYIASNEKDQTTSLTLTGDLNGTDIRFIREMAGKDVNGDATSGKLSVLDISGANIVKGGDPYYSYSYSSCYSSDNTIGSFMFYYCTQLTSILIPRTASSIGTDAFYGCTGLTSITIPNSVTSIGYQAFYNCSGLKDIICQGSKPAQLESSSFDDVNRATCILWVPESASEDYSSAQGWNNFNNIIEEGTVVEYDVTLQATGQLRNILGANSLKHVTKLTISGQIHGTDIVLIRSELPALRILNMENAVIVSGAYYGDNTTTDNQIGNSAFSGCIGLTSVTIPNTVTSIVDQAFYGCTGLTSITIPNSVITIGDRAFSGCTGLTSVTIPNTVTSIVDQAFQGCTGLTSVTIPNSVTTIGNSAFFGCIGLTSITIPNTVTSIGYQAFLSCSRLTSVTIPNSVTSIGEHAFAGCTELTSVTIGNSLTSIGNYAFWGCTGLTSIIIPNSVDSIGTDAFYNCSRLTSITIGNSVTSIGVRAFQDCAGLTSVTIPNSVTSIVGSAFKGCKGLTSVTIGNSVTSIGGSAFEGCSRLNSVTIPNSVTSIGNNAFWNCSGLTSVTFGNSVTSIGNSAFNNCTRLNSVTIPNSVTSIGDYAFSSCKGLTSVTIGNSVTSIGKSAFSSCKGLTSITIPNSITSIGERAFDFTGLTSVSIPNSVISIGSSAFDNCSKLASLIIGNSVTSIGDCAFLGCSGLPSLTIPNSVTSIGKSAFYSCSGLKDIICQGSKPAILGSSCFDGVNKTTCILWIPESATEDYSSAQGWNSFISIIEEGSVIEYNVTLQEAGQLLNTLGVNNLKRVTKLTISGQINGTDILLIRSKLPVLRILDIENAIIVSGGVAYYEDNATTDNRIGDYAFQGCSELTSVTIPNSVTSIGINAFIYCSGLKEIHSRNANPPTAGSLTFYGIDQTTCTLYVPKGSLSSYRAAAGWSGFWNIIEEDITSNALIQSGNIKVYTEAEAIIIEGAELRETISIYTESGALVQTTEATDNIIRINVHKGHIYLIKTVGKTFKIAL